MDSSILKFSKTSQIKNNIPKQKFIKRETLADLERIEEKIISVYKQNLGQAQCNLFTTTEVIKLFDTDRYSKDADSILDISGIDLTPLQNIYFSNLQFKENKGKNNIKSTD